MGGCVSRTIFLFLIILITFFTSFSFASSYNNTYEPIEAWYLINGSFIDDVDINNYKQKINITDGISDDNDVTKYSSTISDIKDIYNFYYMFNDYSSYSAHDSSIYDNHLTIMTNAKISEKLNIYSLECVQENAGGSRALHEDDFNIGVTNFTIGFIINFTNSSSFASYLMRKYEYPDGFYFYIDRYSKMRVMFRDSNGVYNGFYSNTLFNDSITHSVIVRRNINSGLLEFIVDGVVELNGTLNTFGDYSNYANLEIGSISESYGFNGFLDEVFLTNTFLTDSEINDYNIKKHIYNKSTGDTIQIFFDEELNITNSYSLHIKKVDTTENVPIRIYSGINNTHINISNYIDFIISEGNNYLNIDDIIYNNYNQPFRLGNLHNEIDISEINLIEIGNDTINPIIHNCYVNNTLLNCNDSVTWSCNITDDSFVSNVWFKIKIKELNHTLTQQAFQNPTENSIWELKINYDEMKIMFQSLGWTFNGHLNLTLDYVNATDIAGNVEINNSITPSISSSYICYICFENWIEYFDSCLINDSKLKYYLDDNLCSNILFENYPPIDNGSYINCDYCVSDIQEIKGLCTYQNSTYIRNVSYVDNLYPFCCAITGLESDCSVDYLPYNESYTEFCTIFNNTMECDSNTYTEFGFFGDKARWLCYPPYNENTTTHCMSYVRDVHTGVIQTNPNYYTKSESLISLDSEIETRTSFEAVGNMVSVYFTKDNLIFDGREYVFGVRCTNNGNYYDYERLISPEYENVNSSITRWMWLKDNIVGLFFCGVFTFVIILVVAGYIRELRK